MRPSHTREENRLLPKGVTSQHSSCATRIHLCARKTTLTAPKARRFFQVDRIFYTSLLNPHSKSVELSFQP